MKVRNAIFLFAIVTSISATEIDDFELRLRLHRNRTRHSPGHLVSRQYQRSPQRYEFRNGQRLDIASSIKVKNSGPLKPSIITVRRERPLSRPRPRYKATDPSNRRPPQPPYNPKPIVTPKPLSRKSKASKPTKSGRTDNPTTTKTTVPTKTTQKTTKASTTPTTITTKATTTSTTTGKTNTTTTTRITNTTTSTTTRRTNTTTSTTTRRTNTTTRSTTSTKTTQETESDSSSDELTLPTVTRTDPTTRSKKTTIEPVTTTTARRTSRKSTTDGILSSEEETSSSEDTVEHTSNENSQEAETDSYWDSDDYRAYKEYKDDSSKTTVTMTVPPTDPPEYLEPPDTEHILQFINAIIDLTCFYNYIIQHGARCTKIVNQFQFCPKDPDGVREYYISVCKDYLKAVNTLCKVCHLSLGAQCFGSAIVAVAQITKINYRLIAEYMWFNLSKMDICMRENAVNIYCDGYKGMGDLAICTIKTVADFIG